MKFEIKTQDSMYYTEPESKNLIELGFDPKRNQEAFASRTDIYFGNQTIELEFDNVESLVDFSERVGEIRMSGRTIKIF